LASEHVERRLTAILAADVAGYSRLMGADEEGTLAKLKAHRRALVDPKIADHRGRIVKTTGDGMLAEFGSVVDAVRCAVEIQRGMAERNLDVPAQMRIEFRIGVHQGDIIIDGEDIYGDGVNVAARLEGFAEPAGICVSGRVQEDAQGKLDVGFEDVGEQQLKNIARRVRIYRVRLGGAAETAPSALPLPDQPSIAVLPFNLMQGDADDEAFADGLTEDIITALSRVGGLFIIARNSSFIYKDRTVDIRQVGRELGVRYVMEGSVRRSKDRLRVSAQLLEASSGNHIWAEKYDRLVADIFDVQDDITHSVTASTQTQINLEEGARAERAERPELNVWLLVKRSWRRCYDLSPEALAEARELAEKAVQMAPESGLAYEVLAVALVHQVFMRTVGDGRATLTMAREAAERALRLPGSCEYAFWGLGMIQFTSGEPEQAILTLRQGLDLNPNCSLIHGTIGNYLALMGRADESIAATMIALRANPRDLSIFFRYQALADAYFVKRDFEKMLEWAAKSLAPKSSYIGGHLRVIAGLAILGRDHELASALARYVRDVPDDVRSRVNRVHFVRPEDNALFAGGLAKAGLLA